MFCFRSTRPFCALLALSIGPGFATVVTYSDQPTWQTATASGFTTITFDGLAPLGSSTQFTTGLVIGDGTSFYGVTSGTQQLWVYNQAPGPSSYYNYGSGPVLVGPAYYSGSFVPYISIVLPRPVTSFGVDLMTLGGSGISYNVNVNNTTYSSAPTFAWSSTSPEHAFFGFTADTAFSQLFLSLPTSASGVFPLIDNFRYGDAAAAPTDVPEACTLLLIGSGLIGLSLFRRRLRRVAESVRSPSLTAAPGAAAQ